VLRSTVHALPYLYQIADVLDEGKLKLILLLRKGNALGLPDREFISVEEAREAFDRLAELRDTHDWRPAVRMTPWTDETEGHMIVIEPNGNAQAWWRRICTHGLCGCGAGFGEGEALVAEVGDDLQAAAEGFDVGGEGAQFGGAGPGVLDGGDAALGDAHPGGDVGLGNAQATAHLGEPVGTLLGAQLLHPGRDRCLVGGVGVELGEELIPGVMVELGAHLMLSLFR
jgi:hypothetical protein